MCVTYGVVVVVSLSLHYRRGPVVCSSSSRYPLLGFSALLLAVYTVGVPVGIMYMLLPPEWQFIKQLLTSPPEEEEGGAVHTYSCTRSRTLTHMWARRARIPSSLPLLSTRRDRRRG
jgi:hypothetical protein